MDGSNPKSYGCRSLSGSPLLLYLLMALLPLSGPIMMAKPALEGLIPCSMQLTQGILEEVAPFCRMSLYCKVRSTTIEGRRKNAKVPFGRNFQHHARRETCRHCL
jgi:hypothetical protein